MSFSTCSAGALPGPDFCFIFAPGGYDEPEILPPQNPSVCLTGPDGEQISIDAVMEHINEITASWDGNVKERPPMLAPALRGLDLGERCRASVSQLQCYRFKFYRCT